MEENSSYLPYFYFFISLFLCYITLASTHDIDTYLLTNSANFTRCTPDSCFKEPAMPTITPEVQDTQANSFKKTATEKMGLLKVKLGSSQLQESQINSSPFSETDTYHQMAAKSEWWVKRLIYDVRDMATMPDAATENEMMAQTDLDAPEDANDTTDESSNTYNDTRIVDGALYINGMLASPEEQQLMGLASPKPAQHLKIVDGKLYINGELAKDDQTALITFPDGEIGVDYNQLQDKANNTEVFRATASRNNTLTASNNLNLNISPGGIEAESTEAFSSSDAINVSDVVPADLYKPSGSPVSGSMSKVLLADVYAEDIPCYAHYDYNWSTTNVHPYRYDLSKMPETVEFFLTHGLGDDFTIPVGGIVTSGFGPRWGRYHNGVDLDLDTGDGVKAAFDGRVRIAQYSNSYGYVVIIRHFNGLETTYAHLSKLLVSPNQKVKAGDIVALGGSTGHSTGSHLHFEVRYKGLPLDPTEMFDFSGKKLKSHTFVVDRHYFSSSSPYLDAHDNSYTRSSYKAGSSSSSSSKAKYHTVKKGDTISAIASRYGRDVKDICRLNRISGKTTLRIGQKLRVK